MIVDSQHILLVSNQYPSDGLSGQHTFVSALVQTMTSLGLEITVIAPSPCFSLNKKTFSGLQTKIEKKSGLTIIRPPYLSVGSRYLFKGFNTARLSAFFFKNAVTKALKYVNGNPPVCVYGHFLYPSGFAAAEVGRIMNIPSFFAYGESGASYRKRFGYDRVTRDLERFAGIIAVSDERKRHLIKTYRLKESQIKTIHNAADTTLFYPRNKAPMRKRYGFPQDDFIVAFAGHFVAAKGIGILINALDRLPDVKAICLGSGPIVPSGLNILHAGRVEHKQMPEFLSCADLFVLPTLMEGCSNAIQEAMACGLPIISSDRDFNHEVLDESFTCFIDPRNADQLIDSIRRLQNDRRRLAKMGEAALNNSHNYNLEKRAKLILSFINEKIEAS